MIKIWFMLVLMSAPNMPSVKYNGIIYATEEECLSAQATFLNLYEAKPKEYKDLVAWVLSEQQDKMKEVLIEIS